MKHDESEQNIRLSYKTRPGWVQLKILQID